MSVAEAEAAGYKRAGNCPAEVVALKPSITVAPPSHASTLAKSKTAKVAPAADARPSLPAAASIMADPALMPPGPPETQYGKLVLRIIGNKNSKIFHQPWCSGYERVSEKNRAYFNSGEEAEAAGYKRADNCSAEVAALKSSTTVATQSNGSTLSKSATTKVAAASDARPSLPVAASIMLDPASMPPGPPEIQYSKSPLRIIGNKNSQIFHQPWCSGYERVSEKNRAYFNSGEEAEKAGYRLAKNCSGTSPY